MTTIKLGDKVEAATGPDRSIDFDIELHVHPTGSMPCPHYTASVDAVIGLIGEKSNWHWVLHGGENEPAHTIIDGGFGDTWIELAAVDAPTPALSLLLAFLRAWEQRGDG